MSSTFLCGANEGIEESVTEPLTCMDCVKAEIGIKSGSCDDVICNQEIEDLKDELHIEKEIHLHGCECSADEACEFARERDRYKRLIIRDKDNNVVTQAAFNALVAQRDTAWNMQEILKCDIEKKNQKSNEPPFAVGDHVLSWFYRDAEDVVRTVTHVEKCFISPSGWQLSVDGGEAWKDSGQELSKPIDNVGAEWFKLLTERDLDSLRHQIKRMRDVKAKEE